MDVVGEFYTWTDDILFIGLVALRLWALGDCVTRKARAFPAADKLTKPAWIAILLIAGVLGTLLGRPYAPGSVAGVFSLISAVVATVYLADVRPAVREISR